jgi:hypothetical protein
MPGDDPGDLMNDAGRGMPGHRHHPGRLVDHTATSIEIRSFRWLNADVWVTTGDGGVTINARDGWKLFLSNGRLQLQIKPNPARERAEINYEVIEQGRTTLVVRNAIGQEVQTVVDAEAKPGSYTIRHDLTEFAAGVYYYVLKTPGGQFITPLVVVH